MILDETKRGNAECATRAKQQATIEDLTAVIDNHQDDMEALGCMAARQMTTIDALVEALEEIGEANNPIWITGRINEALALAKGAK